MFKCPLGWFRTILKYIIRYFLVEEVIPQLKNPTLNTAPPASLLPSKKFLMDGGLCSVATG